jgi:hypothetical protein
MKKKKFKKQAKKTWFPQPVKKKAYEMPDNYKRDLHKLTDMLDHREEYNKLLPLLPPEKLAEAMPIIRNLDKTLDEIEQKLADEYEDFQNHQQELEENKDEARARVYEFMQRLFIVAKHKFEPVKFKEYERDIMQGWSSEFKEQFYDHIALRESYDLENILSDPVGEIKRPMKPPNIQMKEAIFDINRLVYETPDDFKEMEAEYERVLAIRDRVEKNLWLYDPDERKVKREQIKDLDNQLDNFKLALNEYLEICFKEDGAIEVKNPDQKKVDAAFAQADVAHERIYLMYKHAKPELLEDFTKTCLSAYETPEEIEQFYQRVAKRETEELDKILESLKPPDDKL